MKDPGTSLQVGSNVNSRRVTRWGSVVIQRETPPAPFERREGQLKTVSYAHPLGSSADLAVSECGVYAGRKPDAEIMAKLSGPHRTPDSRLGYMERTAHQWPQAMRSTTYCDDYSAQWIAKAHGLPTGGAPAPAAANPSAPVPVALSGLTAEELDRVSRFGILPEGEQTKLKAAATGTSPAWMPKN